MSDNNHRITNQKDRDNIADFTQRNGLGIGIVLVLFVVGFIVCGVLVSMGII